MARDFEDLDDIEDLSDEELRGLVRARLAENDELDTGDITVNVRDGVVYLSGRVGTDSELRVAEHVVTDVIGIADVRNELVVDELSRAVSPEAIDDHLEDEEEHDGQLLGDRATLTTSPEAEHLEEDLDARLFGTTDLGNAIERGTAWIPPSTPTPEGFSGDDTSPEDLGERH